MQLVHRLNEKADVEGPFWLPVCDYHWQGIFGTKDIERLKEMLEGNSLWDIVLVWERGVLNGAVKI